MNKDLLSYAIKSLTGKRTRTFLTTLSILIGIMAIFTLISFGQGLSTYVNDISAEMGTDKLMIQSKATSGAIPQDPLTKEDLEFIKKIKGVEEASGWMMASIKIQPDSNTKEKYAFLAGMPTDKNEMRMTQEMMTVNIMKGRDLKKGDNQKIVLGSLYSEPNKVFEKPLELGQKILVNDAKVEIIGFYEPIGNPQDDTNVYITYEGFEELMNIKDEYSILIVRAEKNVNVGDLSERIKHQFRRYKNQEEGKEDFTVQTFEELIAQFQTILGVLNVVLIMIALVSVVISAINITNTMYTSVLERTKDIGIMKAIGAKNKDILLIFVIESGFLGFVGGVMGVSLGYLISSAGANIIAATGYGFLKPAFTPALIIGCILFATIVGAISGLAPAKQASMQKPVDSLRYE
ncbi:MAG: ABC transporter permease [Nanoarchaeota archaeon]|nr:ABC transporter permease [Nanoarchaeota archaeon]MBU1269639.1 ABC transporter permease [Nanoarchaeota archaeon]MBU1604752.1 ABC transporter permease [Nanoarchaeota archaeon]MBU2443377.1 ABC transporter permease [Nanoarchaeota archaeon]